MLRLLVLALLCALPLAAQPAVAWTRGATCYEVFVRSLGEMSDGNSVLLSYYPDQLDSYFAFEVADSIVTAVRNGSAKGLLSPLLGLQARLPRDRWPCLSGITIRKADTRRPPWGNSWFGTSAL